MSTPRRPLRPSDFRWVITLVAGVVGVAAGLLWMRCVHVALIFHFSSDPAVDPHGYRLIFGTVFSLPTGLVTALALPFAFPARYRRRVARILIPVLLVVTAAVWVAFVATS